MRPSFMCGAGGQCPSGDTPEGDAGERLRHPQVGKHLGPPHTHGREAPGHCILVHIAPGAAAEPPGKALFPSPCILATILVCKLRQTPRYLLIEPADSNPSSGTSPPSQPGTITPEDLELLLEEGLASSESLSLEEISERYESICLPSTASVTEQDTPKRWKQLEQWAADLQAEVVLLRGHKACCEHTTLSLLRELRQVHACLQLQDSELKRLQQAAQASEKEALQFPSLQNQNQMQTLNKRLVEVREALTQIRRKQALQDSERKGAEQEASLRLSELTEKLKQEERDREVTCGALQKSQEEASQRVGHEVARMQAQMTKLREEMSLRFLRREAKLCSFLQKSFLALEKRMKASESAQLRAESSLQEDLESKWQQLRELDAERTRALQGQRQEECHLLEQCRGLDKAVVQLTEFMRQNQASLSHVLLAEQKAWDAKGQLENSRAGELATYLQESLEAMQLASELAQQEMHSALELLREKSQALEVSVAELVRQVKDMSDHFLALSWRLDLQEQTLSLRLCEVQSEWGVAEQRWQEGLARCREEAKAHLREVQQRVDILPQQIEAVADRCILHKSDSDLKISTEAKAREFEGEAVRQELAALLSSVQLLREGNPGRKIAEIQGKLATFQNQMMKLESSIQDNKTIQNLKFNTETKRRTEEMATLRSSVMHLWSEEGPGPTLGSRRVLMSLVRQQFFIKDVAPDEVVPVNHWGVYQAVRWLQWKAVLMKLVARRRPRAVWEKPLG
ncbi:LOW QUALITY PROTEIN: coiled-coil domain-containing protein 154 [Balaenoptera musculus]|uniref:LOW QUALITY PROTEIN: coiled-coil domain-containing protein 154 n=1 Tax=Balaenoptera musculus TaxID=9771 RepID=A0A8B8VCM3_BALMU|nr:LOW QUALITY PROTEIN: coiled-coil domain-containing protein 154 [Balaenoptera musculus]